MLDAIRSPRSRHAIAVSSAALTCLTMTGTIAFVLLVWIDGAAPLPARLDHAPIGLQLLVGLPILLLPLAVASTVWGLGIALLTGAPVVASTRRGLFSITGMVALLEIPVHLSQALPSSVFAVVPLGIHGVFTLVFATEIALIAGVASTRIAATRSSPREASRIGRHVALVAAGAFLVGSLIALPLGYRVDVGRGMDMVWALLVAAGASSACAGWMLGWALGRREVRPEHASPSVALSATR